MRSPPLSERRERSPQNEDKKKHVIQKHGLAQTTNKTETTKCPCFVLGRSCFRPQFVLGRLIFCLQFVCEISPSEHAIYRESIFDGRACICVRRTILHPFYGLLLRFLLAPTTDTSHLMLPNRFVRRFLDDCSTRTFCHRESAAAVCT